ncbi:MAG TPA: chemotaxis protein CheX [Anaerolineaceae bacterium]|nr:chemotaxis protein CheX [Anaerolineaceae bacterium]HPN52543.1 chemotaxis protein CheX [Anaerolineaceae bacterium]
MNVKYLIPFVEAAYEVLKAEAHITMTRGELSLEKSPYVTDDVTVLISLVGDVQGTVFYGMNAKTCVAISSAIMGEQLKELNNLAQSGIAELGNVITGRASVKLSQTGFQSTISPPTLLLAKGATISTLDFARLVVPLTSDVGNIVIHLALRESATKGANAALLKVPSAPGV